MIQLGKQADIEETLRCKTRKGIAARFAGEEAFNPELTYDSTR
jgi:hypothetical protein